MEALESAALGFLVGAVLLAAARYGLALRAARQPSAEAAPNVLEPLAEPAEAPEPQEAPAEAPAPRPAPAPEAPPAKTVRPQEPSGAYAVQVSPDSVVTRSVIAIGDVLVGAGARVRAEIRATGRVVIQAGARVDRVRSRGDVLLERDSAADSVESEGTVTLQGRANARRIRARSLTRTSAPP